jgi:hypothetical protein
MTESFFFFSRLKNKIYSFSLNCLIEKTEVENNVQSASQTQNNTYGKINAASDGVDMPAFVKCCESKPDQRFKVRERNLITVSGKVSRNDEPFVTQKEIIVTY